MSTTDTRISFEEWARARHLIGKTAYSPSGKIAWEAWQAATEAAKATGTAGELPQDVQELFDYLRPEIDYYCKSRHAALKALKSLERKFRELSAEAARQPAPVVAVKTWQDRCAESEYYALEPIDARDAEIADLRAALALKKGE